MQTEEEAMKEYADAGVELPELKEEPKEPEAPQPKEEPPVDEPKEPEPLQENEPKVERKRSIYDEYKEKKSELKSERELREQVERERDELRVKLEARENAVTPEEKKYAQTDLDSFAQEIGADPQAIKKMRELFLKDVQPTTDPALVEKLAKFEAWQEQNQVVMEKQMFEDEFNSSLPKLKDILPKASDSEMQNVKKEIERLSHTKEYYDKDLDYIAWKEKDTLNALISPKKAGLERKGRVDAQEEHSTEFDPNADYSKMSLKEREQWEENYRKMVDRAEGLSTGADGKKILI
jgi:hypothetical protein